MNLKEFTKSLYEYNDEELLYKKYYEENNKEELVRQFDLELHNNFIKNVDLGGVEKDRYFVSEVTGERYLRRMDEHIFPKEDNVMVTKHNRFTLPFLHNHRFFEIMYMLSGSGVQTINQERIEMKAGDILFLAPKITHSVAIFEKKSVMINILVKASTFQNVFLELFKDKSILGRFFASSIYGKSDNDYLLFSAGQDWEIKNKILNLFMEVHQRKPYYNRVADCQTEQILWEIIRKFPPDSREKESGHNNNRLIVEMLTYIRSHYKDVTLDSISGEFHFCKQYVSKIIKNETGSNFIDILTGIRMDVACKLLVETNLKIADISEMSGYDNSEHFARTFKKNMNCSPNQYRRNHS